MTQQLLTDLQDFLTSSATTVEWMSDDLREAVSIETSLEHVIAAAVAAKRTVVIAGTAGSGKTHLLRMAGQLDGCQVIPDLAALPTTEWQDLFKKKSKVVVVAGNEGAFLSGAGIPGFDDIVASLHELQKGNDPQSNGAVVIDAAGYDPAGNHAIAKILQLPILKRYVESKGDHLLSAAWEMMSEEKVRRRIALLVEMASAQSELDGFTFRQIWKFVSDLVEGGTGVSALWFHRVFNGESEISKKIAQSFNPNSLALPHIGNHLWHLDLEFIRDHMDESAIPILEQLMPLAIREKTDGARRENVALLRQLATFASRSSALEDRLERPQDLWNQIRKKQHGALLSEINRYMTYGLLALGDHLELWVQHDTERREIKPNVQISLGTAPSDDFGLRRSVVIANPPPNVPQVEGGRLLLVHEKSETSFPITKDLIDGLMRGRSHQTKERRRVEYDWRLSRLFSAVSSQAARADSLKIAMFDFQARTAFLVRWQVNGARIERLAI